MSHRKKFNNENSPMGKQDASSQQQHVAGGEAHNVLEPAQVQPANVLEQLQGQPEIVQKPAQVKPAPVKQILNFCGMGHKSEPVPTLSLDTISAMNILRSLDGIRLVDEQTPSHETGSNSDWGLCCETVRSRDRETRFSRSFSKSMGPILFLLKNTGIFSDKELSDLDKKLRTVFGDLDILLTDLLHSREPSKKKKREKEKEKETSFPHVDVCVMNKITQDSFIKLFNSNEKKNDARISENLMIFRYFLSKYFESRPVNEFPDGCTTVHDMKLFHFLALLGSLNETLFAGSKHYLNDLALKLLMEVGANATKLTFDSGADFEKVCMAIVIFKYIISDEEVYSESSLDLFRALKECLDEQNESYLKFCFDDEDEFKSYNMRLTFTSSGCAHNTILHCGTKKSKMIDLSDAYNKVLTSLLFCFLWKSPTGSGKSTAMLLTGISRAARTKCDLIYVGPDNGTTDPNYVATICDVVKMHFERQGLVCPNFNIIQNGRIPTKSSSQNVVNVFLMDHFLMCLPLLYASTMNYVVGFDDNNEILPCDVFSILRCFRNVCQIHFTGATLNMTSLDGISICEIGQELKSSVSSVRSTFIHDGFPFTPNQIRTFRNCLLKIIRSMNASGCYLSLPDHSLDINKLCKEYQERSQLLLDCLDKLDFLSRVSEKEPSCSLQNFIVLMTHISFKFPAYQVGKLYKSDELASMSIPAFRIVKALENMGFEFKEPTLQFPKDASESERNEYLCMEIKNLMNGISSPLFVCDLKTANELCRIAAQESFELHKIKLSNANPMTGPPKDDRHQGAKPKKKSHAIARPVNAANDADAAAAAAADSAAAAADSAAYAAADAAATARAAARLDTSEKAKAEARTRAEENAKAGAKAEAATAAANGIGAIDCSKYDDKKSYEVLLDDVVRNLRDKMTLARIGIPTDKDVSEALEILRKCKHPDAIRWLHLFILGIWMCNMIMPKQFISKCLKMYEDGRMAVFLVPELFHFQSLNPDCKLMMSTTICAAVPYRFLLQTITRAGRINNTRSGRLHSLVSSVILPEPMQFCQEHIVPVLQGPVSKQGVSPSFESVVDLLKNMLKSSLFTDRDRNWLVRFLEIFMFAYKDPACKSACEGQYEHMKDFLDLLSGALTSIFASPFNCSFENVDEELSRIAISKYIKLKREFMTKECDEFKTKMREFLGSNELMMSFSLIRAIKQRKPIGIHVSDLPLFFTELYEGYYDSLMHLLKCVQTLLMNVQTTKSFLEEDSMISSMLLIISNTIEFVSNLLEFLSNLLRVDDMERFRVGYVNESDPMDELRSMFQNPVQPTVQELHAFLSRYQSILPDLWTQFCNLEAYLLPNPSGLYYDKNCRLDHLQKTFENFKTQIALKEKLKNTKPDGIKTIVQFIEYKKTDEYLSMCQAADETIAMLSKQCQELQGEIDHLSKELGILPHQISGIVPYIKNLV